MLRNRLIFSLIYSDGAFTQSRNFRLQKVGDINWLERNYKFQKISFSLDELIVLNATKTNKDIFEFSKVVSRLVNDVFIPVAAGGGIKSISDADLLFRSGADKVVVNSCIESNPQTVKEIVSKYGSQSIVACVDYKVIDGKPKIFVDDGSRAIDTDLDTYLTKIQKLEVGEIVLNSIDKDGTGFGFDIEVINTYSELIDVPLIIMGGAGNGQHLKEGLDSANVSAVATANLFNFIGNGLPKAREYMIGSGANLAQWDLEKII
ncbi:HisA/HisF-related TIM barrel protein [Vibrio coralliilyticus]|uniref:HisA/HisF-related TIM barrel protein n=1 Tax=Vibrio coralliilyticus TaxID=190893 RepID=UPI000BAAA973|nr:HisA/HisF-related TIM barrel protein [Vibrio coralliilyticus]NOI60404.1 imidazole glycerol phosphate synthase subunit HisF [Vibrio coralliilyticus]PAT67403.1 imidazole glycerol phosphate synthase cyclase subunit [Vibrio coralliilyticus]